MRKTLNPNAGEFCPGGDVGVAASRKWGNSSFQGAYLPASCSDEREPTDASDETPPAKAFSSFTDGSAEMHYFVPVIRSLLQCRTAFYEHARFGGWKQLEFERLLRRCFFAMHAKNELSISSTSPCGRYGPFWLSYSPMYFLMAHDVVQEIEFGTPSPAGGAALSVYSNSGVDARKTFLKREQLREAYLVNVSSIVPCTLRRELACRARRESAASSSDVKNAVMYALDIFFFFVRLQFLQFLDDAGGPSYSACVQNLTEMREHLLRSEVANSFLNVVLVLVLVSTFHLASAQRAMETATSEAVLTRLTVQYLLCAYFPALVVAFLAGSPLQSMEELRRSFISTKPVECLPVLQSCPAGTAAVRELISYNNKTAMLWSVTMNEVVRSVLRHITTHVDCAMGDSAPLAAWEYMALDKRLHARHPTALSYLLNLAGHVLQKDSPRLQQHCSESSKSEEFHRMALAAASASSGGEYETVFFSLLALANMECFGATELSHLFAALESVCGVDSSSCAFHAFLSSTSCASLGPAARELLDVLAALMRCGTPLQMQAVGEVKNIVDGRHASLLACAPPPPPPPQLLSPLPIARVPMGRTHSS